MKKGAWEQGQLGGAMLTALKHCSKLFINSFNQSSFDPNPIFDPNSPTLMINPFDMWVAVQWLSNSLPRGRKMLELRQVWDHPR